MPRPVLGLAAAVATLVVAAVAVVLLSGQVALVATRGVSMEPVYSQGDLVVVVRAPSYAVGDVAAYDSADGRLVVLHRIIGGDASGFVLKGDNNESVDPLTPSDDELIGRAVLHVPGAGVWLERLVSPVGLALSGGLVLLLASSTATVGRRGSRGRALAAPAGRGGTGRHHLTAPLGAATAVLGVAALGLGIPAWSSAPRVQVTTEEPEPRSVEFSYTASVPPSPAYDTTEVTSPSPVFRALTDTVDVRWAYRGAPATATVSAELSTAGGWRSTVPLAPPAPVDGRGGEAVVTLDLAALQARADAAADVIGLPSEQVQVAVVPRVVPEEGEPFEPRLSLVLTRLQLGLVGEGALLTVEDSTTAQVTRSRTASVGLLGVGLPVPAARAASVALLVGSLAAALALAATGRRRQPSGEGERLRRGHASLVVAVDPVPPLPGQPVVDVPDAEALVRVAERYGLLVLHWSRAGVDTFVVQDQGATYRFRTGAAPSPRQRTAGRRASGPRRLASHAR